MLGAGTFAVALGMGGYLLQGWTLAIIAASLFLILLPPVNYLVLSKAPEDANIVVAFQTAKWLLAIGVVLVTVALWWTFWE